MNPYLRPAAPFVGVKRRRARVFRPRKLCVPNVARLPRCPRSEGTAMLTARISRRRRRDAPKVSSSHLFALRTRRPGAHAGILTACACATTRGSCPVRHRLERGFQTQECGLQCEETIQRQAQAGAQCGEGDAPAEPAAAESIVHGSGRREASGRWPERWRRRRRRDATGASEGAGSAATQAGRDGGQGRGQVEMERRRRR
mmetsp:Transcript_40469/g.92986  ORF Transcript_40469/g.92986 Transcript_40469/m.92986 type:complete len:201 (+) Transcript_40469:1596-2198(+)